jgi:hypothetical protein
VHQLRHQLVRKDCRQALHAEGRVQRRARARLMLVGLLVARRRSYHAGRLQLLVRQASEERRR